MNKALESYHLNNRYTEIFTDEVPALATKRMQSLYIFLIIGFSCDFLTVLFSSIEYKQSALNFLISIDEL